MLGLLRELDRILRGEATRNDDLQDGVIRIPVGGICLAVVLLGMVYGLCMSMYSIVNKRPVELAYVLAPVLKVPLLFFLTLAVTFPSLYVFNALVGSRLSMSSVFRVIIASLAVCLAVLASFGPIVAFFSFTTQSYSFMVLLNVMLFAVAGVLGLTFLLQTLHRLTIVTVAPRTPAAPPPSPDDESAAAPPPARSQTALDRSEPHVMANHVRIVFRIWVVVFGLVGAQMAWVLRPFLGHPDLEFRFFRQRESNFFESVLLHFINLFS